VGAAAAQAVELLVLPECAVQGYPVGLGGADLELVERQLLDAEPVPGPATERLTELAVRHALELVVGMTERPTEPGSGGRLFNTAVLVGPDGVRARYRKVHTGGVEKCLWSRGERWTVVDSVAGRLGFLICYDLVFPEAARCLALDGAQLLVMPTAWTTDETPAGTFRAGYDLFTRARALENQVFFVSANLVGGDGPFHGHSRIVDARGDVIAETEGPGLAVADVDVPTEVLRARARSWFGQVFLNDREPGAYGSLGRTVTP
jgi:predicted amidohydrolase